MPAEPLGKFSSFAAALVFAVGVSVLLGWVLDVGALKSLLPGLATMKVNTALGLMLCAAAVWLLNRREAVATGVPATQAWGKPVRIAQVCAAAAGTIGLLTLAEYAFGRDFGIDQLLIRDSGSQSSHPGRMAQATAANLVLLATALLLADFVTRSGRWPAQWFAIAAGLNSFVVVLGYAYGAEALYAFHVYGSIALHTALMFLLLSVAFLCARPRRGLLKMATGSDAGSVLFRRLFPAAILVPPTLGWLRLKGQQAGFYSTEFGLTLFAAANVVVFAVLIWRAAISIQSAYTERRRAVDSLRESEIRLRTVFDSAMSAVVVIDAGGRITDWNARAERMFGWSHDEIIGQEVADTVVPPRHRDAHRRGLERYLATGDGPVLNRLVEMTALRRDGGEFPIELSINPMKIGDAVTFCGFITDVTERKRADEALHKSQELLRAFADNSSAIIWVKDLDGRYLLINGRYEDVFRQRREEIIGKTDYDLLPKAQADIFHAIDRDALASAEAVQAEEVVANDDGSRSYLLSVKSSLRDTTGKPYALCGISTDITDRRRAEEAVREIQASFQTLAESLPHLVWTCNPDGYCDYLSRQWVEYTGRPAEEQLGYGWGEQMHPDDRERVQKAWAAATANGDQFDVEFRIRRADGAYRWFKTRAVPLRDAGARIVKWFGSNTDFHDYKLAEQKLEAQLRRLSLLDHITRAIGERQDLQSIFQVVIRSLEDHLPLDFGCVCLYDAVTEELTVTKVGAHSEKLAMELALTERTRVGIDQNGLSRCVHGQLVHEPDISQSKFPFPQRLAQGGLRSLVIAPLLVESRVFGILVAARREARGFSSGECEFLRQLSEHIALAAHQAQLYGALQQAYDDLRQTQQAVMQQERLRALGQMASGIAHDINNAISPVALYTESLLEKEPNLSTRARDYLQTIQRAIDDVAKTVLRMKEFYRQREPQLTLAPVHVNQLVQQVADLTRARWSDMPQQRGIVIRMQAELAPDLPAIMCIESEIREALTNLVFNAVDAMPDGGSLTLRTKVTQDAPGSGKVQPLRRVWIEVTDTGVGMDENTQRRCLEPFFTTKGDRGTGLGLAMVYGIIQRHSAEVEIESATAKGTTMRLGFVVPSVAAAVPDQRAAAYSVPSRLRILVVDDDPLLLKSLRDILETDGHLVVPANNGQAGIDAFLAAQKRGEPFAIVITDLGMPYVDGRKVSSAIKGASASTPVILLTGWGQRLMTEGDVPPHVDHVLAKPPRLSELREALARCLAVQP